MILSYYDSNKEKAARICVMSNRNFEGTNMSSTPDAI